MASHFSYIMLYLFTIITNISSQNMTNYLYPYARYIGREGQMGLKDPPKDDHYKNKMTTPGKLTPPLNVIMENLDNKEIMAAAGIDIDKINVNDIPQLVNKLGLGTLAHKFTTQMTVTTKKVRTTPLRISLLENCDYLATKCLNAYITGKVCARTMFYKYYTFNNYCLMDYVNCMERYEIWQAVHMGECFHIQKLTDYKMYPYNDDYFLDSYYVLET